MSLGIYRDSLEEEVAYLVDYAGIAVILAEDEEQVDKLLGLGDRIGSVRHIVYADPRGMRKHADPRLVPLPTCWPTASAGLRQPARFDDWSRRRTDAGSRSSAPPRAPPPTPSWRC
jgi:long-chain acyl-CoA synthetase